jgi:hypothetical protein
MAEEQLVVLASREVSVSLCDGLKTDRRLHIGTRFV